MVVPVFKQSSSYKCCYSSHRRIYTQHSKSFPCSLLVPPLPGQSGEREGNCESSLPNNTTKQSGHGFRVIVNWASKVVALDFASLCSVIGPKITTLLFLGQFVSFYFEFWLGSSDFSIVLIGHWYFFDFGFKMINIEICFNSYSRVQQANWLTFVFPLIFLCHDPRIMNRNNNRKREYSNLSSESYYLNLTANSQNLFQGNV